MMEQGIKKPTTELWVAGYNSVRAHSTVEDLNFTQGTAF